jgi:hypothetical protein
VLLLLLVAALAVDCSSTLLLLLLLHRQLKGGRHVGCDSATTRLLMLQQLLQATGGWFLHGIGGTCLYPQLLGRQLVLLLVLLLLVLSMLGLHGTLHNVLVLLLLVVVVLVVVVLLLQHSGQRLPIVPHDADSAVTIVLHRNGA